MKKEFLSDILIDKVPFAQKLGMTLDVINDNNITLKIPYQKNLTLFDGIIHGGVLSTIIDHTMGMSVLLVMPEPAPLVTLDLRVDYSRMPDKQADIYCKAYCYRQTQDIFLTKACVFNHHEDDPICYGVGVFMKARLES